MDTVQFIVFTTTIVVFVNAGLVNVAVGKTTTQSGEVWPSSNAVDGISHCPVINGTYYTLTYNSHLPSWQVDLGDEYRIEQINVYGRHDHFYSELKGFRVFLSSDGNFTEQSKPVYTNTAATYNNGTITIISIPSGLYRCVKLDLPDTYRSNIAGSNTGKQIGPLVLCEVEVFVKECKVGRFGRNCSSYCSTHCLNGLSHCDTETGKCNQGCEAGYMGKNCSSVCSDGKYGPDCNETCTNNCYNGLSQCNKTTGDCIQGCTEGYFGNNCSSECADGKYGNNCIRSCYCFNGEACNKADGYCKNGCAFGWAGPNCSLEK